ncbi:putative selenium delivery protein YdfZ, partial [Salmonella enterica subsp. enterica serovar Infantis]
SGTGHTGLIKAIDSEGMDAGQIRRGNTVSVEGCGGKYEPVELIRLGMY